MKIFIWGDGGVPTGFSRVNTEIAKGLPKEAEVHHLAINYKGDPIDLKDVECDYRLYPASAMGDIYGFNRIREFGNMDFDVIYLLNDLWVTDQILMLIKKTWKEIPPIVIYFPVDATGFSKEWFQHFDIVTIPVVYTEFGRSVCNEIVPEIEFRVIAHGTNFNDFYQMDKLESKKKKFSNYPELWDTFIVLNANRNQPRKRVDITIQGFSAFSAGKPSNVKLYLHMGVEDEGFNILKLASRFGISDRLIISGKDATLQSIPEEKLNIIYNATDVGLNTAIGEGWSLTNMEHAVTGAPQIVPDHSALKELYSDCGLLMPVDRWLTNKGILTISGFVQPLSVAEKLEEIYSNKELYNELSEKTFKKFTDKKYEWSNIVKNSWLPIFRDTYD